MTVPPRRHPERDPDLWTPATAPTVGGSCRPDLPSDRCH